MEFSIITEINTELISVLGIDIKEKIENDNKIFIQNKEYPNDQEIKEMYKELKDWQSFKKKSIDNVLINKKNKNGVSLNRFLYKFILFFKKLYFLRSPISIPHIVKSPENIKDINSHPGLAYCKMKFLI